jgi:hypothetical protein
MVAVSVAKYLPQIRRIVMAGNVTGLAPAAYYGDALVFCTKSTYHLRRGHPVSAWGELLVLFAQIVVVIGLLCKYSVPEPIRCGGDQQRTVTRRVTRDVMALGAFVYGLYKLPERLLPFMSVFTAPLLVLTFSAQIMTNLRRQSTGRLSMGTVILRLFGSFVRVTTTITQLGGEFPVLINHAIGLAGCSLLLGQILWYGRRTNPEAHEATTPVAPAIGGL